MTNQNTVLISRDFSNLGLYNTKYIPMLYNKKRYNFYMGGGGSGKSRFIAQKEIIESYNKGNRLLGVRKVGATIKDSVFAELEGVIKDWELDNDFEITKSPMRIINKLSGSDMLFRGLDDVEKLKSIKEVTRIWIEEATETVKGDFDQLDIRLRGIGKQLQLTCSYNPISDQHWLITDFWIYGNTNDVECLHSTYLDNRFVGHETYEKVFARLKETDINLYNIYALGIAGKALEGLIFSYEVIPELPKEAKLLGYGLDFGYTHPACLVGIYEYNDKVIIDEEFHKSGMIDEDYVNYFTDRNISKSIDIFADNSRPESIAKIHKSGFNCKPCNKGKDSVINGITLMKGLKLCITSKSSGVRKDFDNYVWAKDRLGKVINDTPVKLFDDGPDASRYAITEFFGGNVDFIFA